MQKLQETGQLQAPAQAVSLPVSVIVPVRNEAHNLPRCLNSLAGVGEVYVIDSQSSDETTEIAQSFGAKVIQFHYQGAGRRSGSGRSIPFRLRMTGSFFSMPMRPSRQSWQTKSETRFGIPR